MLRGHTSTEDEIAIGTTGRIIADNEARELYLGYAVAGAGEPLLHPASANLKPWTKAKMPGFGPSLIIDGGWRDVAEKALRFVERFA